MTTKIQPYQFMQLQEIMNDLIHSYQSLSDFRTIETVRAIAVEKIQDTIPDLKSEAQEIGEFALTAQLRHRSVDQFFETFKDNVIPFVAPSQKQVEKVFRKVKKLKVPEFASIDLRDYTYYGWNDIGSQRKFILYYDEHDKLAGVYGSMSPTVVKGFCAICQHESNVALFATTTKHGSEGQYTKKGNYICTDSTRCNHQLCRRADLDAFVASVK
jgi:hypothetical protein